MSLYANIQKYLPSNAMYIEFIKKRFFPLHFQHIAQLEKEKNIIYILKKKNIRLY